eukprot:jgi/Botrbrau1/10961/Bobra.0383s0015.1
MDKYPGLSERARRAHIENYVLKYFSPIEGMLRSRGAWSDENRQGSIIMAVAENCLAYDLVADRMARAERLTWPEMAYPDNTGTDEIRCAFAHYIGKHLLKGLRVDPHHLVVQAGCGSLVDMLFFSIADSKDAVLIPAPYYPAFDNDLTVRNEVSPIPVYLDRDAPKHHPTSTPSCRRWRTAAGAAGPRTIDLPARPTRLASCTLLLKS